MGSLSDMCSDTSCTIKWMFGLPEETDRALKDCEIIPGRKVHVIQNNYWGLIINSGGRRIAIDPALASKILV